MNDPVPQSGGLEELLILLRQSIQQQMNLTEALSHLVAVNQDILSTLMEDQELDPDQSL